MDESKTHPWQTAAMGQARPDPAALVQRPRLDEAEARGAPAAYDSMPDVSGAPPAAPTPVDPTAELQRRRDELANTRNPRDENGRLASIFRRMGQMFIEGGPRGAIVGAIHAAVAPNVDERDRRDREVARLDTEIEGRRKRYAWQAAIAQQQADTDHKRAQAEAARRKPDEIERRLDQTDRRLDIAEAFNAGRMSQGERRLSQGDRRLDLQESAQASLEKFRATKMYADLRQRQAEMRSRESVADKNRAAAGRARARRVVGGLVEVRRHGIVPALTGQRGRLYGEHPPQPAGRRLPDH